jgi:hypothetical protein
MACAVDPRSGPVAAVRNPVGCSCHRTGSPRNRARSFLKCAGCPRTTFGGSRTSIACPCKSTGFDAASRREGRSPFIRLQHPLAGAFRKSTMTSIGMKIGASNACPAALRRGVPIAM